MLQLTLNWISKHANLNVEVLIIKLEPFVCCNVLAGLSHILQTQVESELKKIVSRIGDKTATWNFSRFSKFLRPVCLPVLSEEMIKSDFSNETATLSGWGYTTLKPEPGNDPRYLQKDPRSNALLQLNYQFKP